MELSSSNITKIPYTFSKKAFLIYSQRKGFSYISQNGTIHLSAQALKIKEIHLRKISYTSGNGNLKKILIFSQKNTFFKFQKTEILKRRL